MAPEEFLDALTVEAELFFDRKEDAYQRERQLAFGLGRRLGTAELGGPGKELQPARAALGTPEVPAM